MTTATAIVTTTIPVTPSGTQQKSTSLYMVQSVLVAVVECVWYRVGSVFGYRRALLLS